MTNLKQHAQQFYAAIDKQDWVELAKLVSPDFISYTGGLQPMRLNEWQKNLKTFYVGFPDGHHLIDEYIITQNCVVTRCRFEGTHNGTFAGIPSTGKKISAGVIHIDHYIDGKIAEHYGQLNTLGLMQQIGATSFNH